MRDTNAVVLKYCDRLDNILQFQYSYENYQVEFQGEIIWDEDELVVQSKEGNTLGVISKFKRGSGVEVKERSIDSKKDASPFEDVSETIDILGGSNGFVAYRFILSTALKRIINDACTTLVVDLKSQEPRQVRTDALNKILERLNSYLISILPTPIQLLILDFPKAWGLVNDEKTETALWSNTTPLVPGDLNSSKVSLAVRVLTEVCSELKYQLISQREEILTPSIYETASGLNNGLFYHIDQKQLNALREFFGINKYENIDHSDKERWVNLLGGLDLPSKPLKWYGPKTHLFYLLLSAVEAKTLKTRSIRTIHAVHQQVQWHELGKNIVLSNGEALSRKHGTNGLGKYRSRKTSPYGYIDVLFKNDH